MLGPYWHHVAVTSIVGEERPALVYRLPVFTETVIYNRIREEETVEKVLQETYSINNHHS